MSNLGKGRVPLTASTHGNDFVNSVLTNENGRAKPNFIFEFFIQPSLVRLEKKNCSRLKLLRNYAAYVLVKRIIKGTYSLISKPVTESVTEFLFPFLKELSMVRKVR